MDDEGEPKLQGEFDMRSEELALLGWGIGRTVKVKTSLADRHYFWARQAGEIMYALGCIFPGELRMDTDGGRETDILLCYSNGLAGVVWVGPDEEHGSNTGFSGPVDDGKEIWATFWEMDVVMGVGQAHIT
jgi:hypothetical protein